MKPYYSLVVLFILAQPTLLLAQVVGHNDIKFDYQTNKIDIKANDLTGTQIGLGEFPLTGIFRQFEVNPGFASENDVGHGINPSDTIVYNVLDRLLFWNGSNFAAPDLATQIRIDNNGAAPDTIVNSSSSLQPGSSSSPANLISQADGIGDFHAHVSFFLEPNNDPAPPPLPELGAYGLKLSFSTDAVGIADSDPFLIVFNFGLDSVGLETAVDHFSELLLPDLPGDYDRSGVVDGDDYLMWQQDFGSPPITSGSGADGNNDGLIDAADYTIWRDNLGASSSPSANSTFGVPEPSTAAIVASAVYGMLVAGHRRHKCNRLTRSSKPALRAEESPMV